MRTVGTREYPVGETLALLQASEEILLEGFRVSTKSLRYRVFRGRQDCASCGVVGAFFLLQRNDSDPSQPEDRAHLNLYARGGNGEQILMTMDHILPRSRGGRDVLSNLHTMCFRCNSRKGSS